MITLLYIIIHVFFIWLLYFNRVNAEFVVELYYCLYFKNCIPFSCTTQTINLLELILSVVFKIFIIKFLMSLL